MEGANESLANYLPILKDACRGNGTIAECFLADRVLPYCLAVVCGVDEARAFGGFKYCDKRVVTLRSVCRVVLSEGVGSFLYAFRCLGKIVFGGSGGAAALRGVLHTPRR